MNTRIVRNRLFIAPAVVVLAAAGVLWGAGWHQSAKAQSGDVSLRLVSRSILGIVPGQKVGVSVANASDPLLVGASLTFAYKVFDQNGRTLFESERTQVPPGHFRGQDLLIGGLDVDGEPGTGRVQMMVQITVDVPSGIEESDVIGSVEIIDEETGQTGTIGWIKVSPDA